MGNTAYQANAMNSTGALSTQLITPWSNCSPSNDGMLVSANTALPPQRHPNALAQVFHDELRGMRLKRRLATDTSATTRANPETTSSLLPSSKNPRDTSGTSNTAHHVTARLKIVAPSRPWVCKLRSRFEVAEFGVAMCRQAMAGRHHTA